MVLRGMIVPKPPRLYRRRRGFSGRCAKNARAVIEQGRFHVLPAPSRAPGRGEPGRSPVYTIIFYTLAMPWVQFRGDGPRQ